MTREEKQLLLQDLSARLPYGVKIETPKGIGDLGTIKLTIFYHELGVNVKATERDYFPFDECKPYLRPLSSITEEEENEWNGLNIDPLLEAVGERHTRIEDLMLRTKSQYNPVDWLNAHHFDYRGLIEKGLALEAPDGMYNRMYNLTK